MLDKAYGEASFFALERAAGALAALAPDAALESASAAAEFCASAAEGSGFRITLVRPDGSVAADSAAAPEAMGDHSGRPELREAPRRADRRFQATLGDARNRARLRGGTREPRRRRAGGDPHRRGGTDPLRAHRAGALGDRDRGPALRSHRGLRRGRLQPFPSPPDRPARRECPRLLLGREQPRAASDEVARNGAAPPAEMAILGSALDSMAAELAERVRAASSQGEELEAVLDSMSEALLALDGELRIRLANPAALAPVRPPFGRRGYRQGASGNGALDRARGSRAALRRGRRARPRRARPWVQGRTLVPRPSRRRTRARTASSSSSRT